MATEQRREELVWIPNFERGNWVSKTRPDQKIKLAEGGTKQLLQLVCRLVSSREREDDNLTEVLPFQTSLEWSASQRICYRRKSRNRRNQVLGKLHDARLDASLAWKNKWPRWVRRNDELAALLDVVICFGELHLRNDMLPGTQPKTALQSFWVWLSLPTKQRMLAACFSDVSGSNTPWLARSFASRSIKSADVTR